MDEVNQRAQKGRSNVKVSRSFNTAEKWYYLKQQKFTLTGREYFLKSWVGGGGGGGGGG